ncbi:MAG: undecaprenyl-diphosphatase UppP [Oligoflexales bacterium]|nr:undecaprenyl-diphosphatase UppP [Oligoflexales bacterium]
MDEMLAFLLGLIQGVAEFLPISSSAHLILLSSIFKGHSISLALNVGLHLGTLFAVLLFFINDWLILMKKSFEGVFKRTRSFEFNIFLPSLLLGSIPAGVIGVLWNDKIEEYFHNAEFVLIPLVIFGILIWYGDKKSNSDKTFGEMTIKDAVIIGVFQAIALIPGVSRSGSTILGGRLLKYNREDAAKFSFMLGTPVMFGAALLESKAILEYFHHIDFIIGFLTSLVIGVLTIKFFLNFLKKFGFGWFAVYRIILAIIIFIFMDKNL